MKELIIVRHAKSSWAEPNQHDFDRPLNDRGLADAPNMGNRLRELSLNPDLMFTSPARRATETCRAISAAMGFPPEKIIREDCLYHASESKLLEFMKGLEGYPGKNDRIFLFGHNPGLTDFVNLLLGISIDNIPTCGVVGCSLDIRNWSDIRWRCGEKMFFFFPKDK
jgi:phosphohistidine phosphatase